MWRTRPDLLNHRASPPFDWHQILLLGDRDTCVWTACPLPESSKLRTVYHKANHNHFITMPYIISQTFAMAPINQSSSAPYVSLSLYTTESQRWLSTICPLMLFFALHWHERFQILEQITSVHSKRHRLSISKRNAGQEPNVTEQLLPASRCQTVSTCEHTECSVQGHTYQQLQHTARSCSLTQTTAQHTHAATSVSITKL